MPVLSMKQFLATLQVSTQRKRELVDITERVREEVRRSAISNGICALYAQGATAALMIQENDDPNITLDVLDCLEGIAPQGRWRHDRVDDNGSAHIQAGLVGPSEVIPHPRWPARPVDLAEHLPVRLRRPAKPPNGDRDDSGRVAPP
jgi:secondary thiamine-phosphate synthase enzyme